MKNNELLIKPGNWVSNMLLKYDLVIIMIILSALILKVLEIPASEVILILVLSMIALIYFLSAFAVPEDNEITSIDRFVIKLAGWGSAISIMGILFRFQHFPNSENVLEIAFIPLAGGLAYMVLQKVKFPEIEKFDKLFMIRVFILLLVVGSLLFFDMH